MINEKCNDCVFWKNNTCNHQNYKNNKCPFIQNIKNNKRCKKCGNIIKITGDTLDYKMQKKFNLCIECLQQ